MSQLTYSYLFCPIFSNNCHCRYDFKCLINRIICKFNYEKIWHKKAGSFALIGAGFIYVLAFVLSIQNPLVFAILLIVAGIVMGYYTISMYAYVTDVIDDFYIKRDTRKDGTIYSVYSFTRKVGQAIAGFLADALLTQIGHVSGAEQQTAEVANSIYLQKASNLSN